VTTELPEAGRLLDGRYRLGTLLGAGGVAEVVRATDERLDREVAVKLFRGDVAAELQRHEDEMRTLARLDHPALVTVYDAGTDPETGRPYLVMQLIEGTTLADELRAGSLSPHRTAELGSALAGALAYVHGQGLVHRDVKPANVLVATDGRVALADFGIARLVNSAHVTRTGDVLGTPAYFAPEQVAGEAVGPAADVYALGLVLLECLTGHREYDGPPMEAAMARLSRQPVTPPGLPNPWRDLIAGMTTREASARLSAAGAETVLTALAAGDERTVLLPPAPPPMTATQVMPPVTTTTTATTAAPAPVARRRGVHPAVVFLLVVLVAAIAAAVALGIERSQSGSATDCYNQSPTITNAAVANDMQKLETLACHS